MSRWHVVLIISCVLNGITLGTEGYLPVDLQFWVWIAVPILTYIAGRGIERGN